jgi:hypothetical protein
MSEDPEESEFSFGGLLESRFAISRRGDRVGHVSGDSGRQVSRCQGSRKSRRIGKSTFLRSKETGH